MYGLMIELGKHLEPFIYVNSPIYDDEMSRTKVRLAANFCYACMRACALPLEKRIQYRLTVLFYLS